MKSDELYLNKSKASEMNKKNNSKDSRTDWERINKMKDPRNFYIDILYFLSYI